MISLVIQAGGLSSRMGRDKGLVSLGGQPMIEHVLAATDGLAAEQVITTNNPDGYQYLGVKLVGDEKPGAGALPGLRTALRAASHELVLLVACDMPFLNHQLLSYQLSLAAEFDLVVPQWEGHYQTMHAIYRREPVLQAVEHALASGQKRMISFYDAVRVRVVLPAEMSSFGAVERSFFNVNTPDELAEAEGLLG